MSKSVYLLLHTVADEDESEDIKVIGCYSSIAKAEAAIFRLSRMAGFVEEPDGFQIDKYDLDVDHWVEGYQTVFD